MNNTTLICNTKTNKYLLCIVLALLLSVSSYAKGEPPILLRTELEISDSDSLYNQVKEVFSYFDIDIKWSENYEKYREQIVQTENFKDFFQQIDSISVDFNSKIADKLPPNIYKYYLKSFKLANVLYLGAYKVYKKKDSKQDAKYKQQSFVPSLPDSVCIINASINHKLK